MAAAKIKLAKYWSISKSEVLKSIVYDTVNFINPEQFTIAISKYDDAYMAQRFIEYFKLLSKDATTPKLLGEMRVHSNR